MIKSVYTKKLDLDLPSIKTYCENWFDNHSSRSVSNRGGLQSDVLSGTHTPLNDLFLEIEKHSNIYQDLHPVVPVEFEIHPWININRPGSYNDSHIHPSSILSGVFYVSTPKDCGNLVFEFDNGDDEMAPIENNLILFPASLSHRVHTNKSKENRISISFNIC